MSDNRFASKYVYTEPAEEPITASQLKTHCRVDTSDDDTYIGLIITAARKHIEGWLGRSLVTQTLELRRDQFPVGNVEMILPYGPVQSVTSITYTDTGGTSQTLSSALYTLDTYSICTRVYPVYGQIWPATRDIQNCVTVRYVAGYGLPSTGLPGVIPGNILHAVKLLAANFYENREPVLVGTSVAEMPKSLEALIAMERVEWL